MSLSFTAAPARLSTPMRLALFAGSAGSGFAIGYGWNDEASNFAYNGVQKFLVDPAAGQVTSLAMGIGLALLLGLIHCTSI